MQLKLRVKLCCMSAVLKQNDDGIVTLTFAHKFHAKVISVTRARNDVTHDDVPRDDVKCDNVMCDEV